jgi:hypothetical protein
VTRPLGRSREKETEAHDQLQCVCEQNKENLEEEDQTIEVKPEDRQSQWPSKSSPEYTRNKLNFPKTISLFRHSMKEHAPWPHEVTNFAFLGKRSHKIPLMARSNLGLGLFTVDGVYACGNFTFAPLHAVPVLHLAAISTRTGIAWPLFLTIRFCDEWMGGLDSRGLEGVLNCLT